MSRTLAILVALAGSIASAAPFDADERRADLSTEAFADARTACFAAEIALDEGMAPVAALRSTHGYGSDNSIEPFAWHVMVLTGRALAGGTAAEAALGDLLVSWASTDALVASEDTHDAHFALKRALQPLITAYDVVAPGIQADQRALLRSWLDRLVAKIDRTFDGDVDRNNHRYLADAVLASWGAATDNAALLDKGEARLRDALLEQMRADGSLPLEARRGARAVWYHRQSLASLTVIVAALVHAGRDPLADPALNEAWDRTVTFFTDSVRWPRLVGRYAIENYIPGPSQDFETQDLGFLDRRGHGRHYLAWAEAALPLTPNPMTKARLDWLIRAHASDERPLIDDFSGGPVTCLYWQPGVQGELNRDTREVTQ